MRIRPVLLLLAIAAMLLLLSGCAQQPTSDNGSPSSGPLEKSPAQPASQPAPSEGQGQPWLPPWQPPGPQEPSSPPSAQCDKPAFTEYFVDPDYLMSAGQAGTVHGSGQFIVERSYLHVKEEFNRQKVPIYAPTDMALTRGAYYQVPAPAGQYLGEPLPDYVVYFDAGCGVEIAFGHLKEMVPSIAEQFPAQPKQDSRTETLRPVKFKAGELIGYYVPGAGVAAFDFFAYDSAVTNQFANQARYEYGYGSTLLHAVCPYDYYSGEMKEAYYDLLGGECSSISRDYPGTISGMWFLSKEITGSIYDYSKEGDYGSVLPIAGDADRVVIGTIGRRMSTFIYPNDVTYKDPKDVTDEHCYNLYQNSNPSQPSGYIFFKLADAETLKALYSEQGTCPASFPPTGGATYYR